MADPARPLETPLYERDFALWAEEQARALAERRAGALDWAHLAEEIESLGGAQRSEIQSGLTVILLHLLKWEHQPERRRYGWKASVIEARVAIETLVEASPSLKAHPARVLAKAYRVARVRAAEETGLGETAFPEACPYTLEQALSGGFYPGPPGEGD